jgi:hypothetical protein
VGAVGGNPKKPKPENEREDALPGGAVSQKLKQGIKGCREKLGSIVKVWFFCRKLLLITGEIYPPFF